MESAVTLLEMLVLVAIMALLAAIILPVFSPPSRKANRINCVSNLKNVGLSFRLFTTDHQGEFPWRLSGTNGTKDLLAGPSSAWPHFAFISNELVSTKILLCPSDLKRTQASSFTNFGPGNLSYFLGLLADEANPKSFLGGDRNVTTNGAVVSSGLLLLATDQNAGFSKKIHDGGGNILFGDGGVQQVTSARFQEMVVDAADATTNTVNRLLIP